MIRASRRSFSLVLRTSCLPSRARYHTLHRGVPLFPDVSPSCLHASNAPASISTPAEVAPGPPWRWTPSGSATLQEFYCPATRYVRSSRGGSLVQRPSISSTGSSPRHASRGLTGRCAPRRPEDATEKPLSSALCGKSTQCDDTARQVLQCKRSTDPDLRRSSGSRGAAAIKQNVRFRVRSLVNDSLRRAASDTEQLAYSRGPDWGNPSPVTHAATTTQVAVPRLAAYTTEWESRRLARKRVVSIARARASEKNALQRSFAGKTWGLDSRKRAVAQSPPASASHCSRRSGQEVEINTRSDNLKYSKAFHSRMKMATSLDTSRDVSRSSRPYAAAHFSDCNARTQSRHNSRWVFPTDSHEHTIPHLDNTNIARSIQEPCNRRRYSRKSSDLAFIGAAAVETQSWCDADSACSPWSICQATVCDAAPSFSCATENQSLDYAAAWSADSAESNRRAFRTIYRYPFPIRRVSGMAAIPSGR